MIETMIIIWFVGFLITFILIFREAKSEAVSGESAANGPGIFIMCLIVWPFLLIGWLWRLIKGLWK